jgi:hypothetical protein
MSMLWQHPVLIAFSIMIGALFSIAVPLVWDSARTQYDREHPVWVTSSATVMDRTGLVVRIHVVGSKTRECELNRTWAQATYPDRPPTDATVQRPGPKSIGYVNRPLGQQDLGEFLVAPIPDDASGAVVWLEHDCGGRVVMSELARLKF